MIKTETVYFESGGKHNTKAALVAARDAALQQDIRHVVIASIRGQSVAAALEVFRDADVDLIIAGCDGCDACPPFSQDAKEQVEKAGHRVVFAPEGAYPYPPAAQLAYRRICEGLKVCVHLAMAVAEQGIVPSGTEIIAMAGTGWKGYPQGGGLDTAVIIQAQTSAEFFSYQPLADHKLEGRKIKQIICKPR